MPEVVLAYTPFIDPIDAHEWWYLLLLPLALFIAMSYRAVRLGDMSRYWRSVGVMFAQTVIGIAGLGVATHLFVRLLLPLIAPGA